MTDTVLYLTPAADRFFVIPREHDVAPGDLMIVSITGEQRRVHPAEVAPLEVDRETAEAHLGTRIEQAFAAAADSVGRALGLAGVGDALPDLRSLAERLELTEHELRDPEAARSALDALATDVHAVSVAVATGASDDLEAARNRLSDRGIDLGDTLGELPGYIAAIRGLDQQAATQAATRGLRALADALEGDQETLGRRVDELVARLERELGPFVGIDPERERRAREEDYRRSARSAIGDALRKRGITPLAGGPDDETRAR